MGLFRYIIPANHVWLRLLQRNGRYCTGRNCSCLHISQAAIQILLSADSVYLDATFKVASILFLPASYIIRATHRVCYFSVLRLNVSLSEALYVEVFEILQQLEPQFTPSSAADVLASLKCAAGCNHAVESRWFCEAICVVLCQLCRQQRRHSLLMRVHKVQGPPRSKRPRSESRESGNWA